MKSLMSISLAVISLSTATFFLSSCELDDSSKERNSEKILIEVNTNSSLETKSGTTNLYETLDLSAEGVPFFLSGSESVFTELPFMDLSTKGSIVTTESINQNGQSFYLSILKGESVYKTVGGRDAELVKATYDSGAGDTNWPLEEEVDWPDDQNQSLKFWAYYYNKGEYERGSSYAEIKYTGPVSAEKSQDASIMNDFLVANTTASANNVNLKFYHALSAVRFQVDSDFADSFHSLIVRVSGVNTKGTVEYTSDPTNMYFKWTELSTPGVYEQILLDSQSKGQSGYNENGTVDVNNSTFFFVPQALGSETDVLFTFILVDDSGQKTVLSTSNLGTSQWRPGYIYNYYIGKDKWGNVGVKVNEGADGAKDDFNGIEKKVVRFENTKSSASYLRATVIANWCASNGKIVSSYDYDGNNDGHPDFNVTPDWVLGDDGYYYSKNPVLGHSESKSFINSFTPLGPVPESAYPLHLEMNILVQAVAFDVKDENETDNRSRAEYAWGKAFTDLLEAKKISQNF